MVWLPQNEMQTCRLNSRLHVRPSEWTLAKNVTLNFQGHMWTLLYLMTKWSDLSDKTKNKSIASTLGLKCSHLFGPCPWPWPWLLRSDWKGWESVIHNHDPDLLVANVRCKDLPEGAPGNLRCLVYIVEKYEHISVFQYHSKKLMIFR